MIFHKLKRFETDKCNGTFYDTSFQVWVSCTNTEFNIKQNRLIRLMSRRIFDFLYSFWLHFRTCLMKKDTISFRKTHHQLNQWSNAITNSKSELCVELKKKYVQTLKQLSISISSNKKILQFMCLNWCIAIQFSIDNMKMYFPVGIRISAMQFWR